MTHFSTWAGQSRCAPRNVERPSSTADVQRVVREAKAQGRRLRVFGSGHSPSDIAMSDDVLVTLEAMNRVLTIDRQARLVTVQGGATLATIDEALRAERLALPNFGSIAVQTIAGAVATATHGTGLGFGTLSSLVEAATLVTGEGEIVCVSRTENAGWLEAVRCHLGALGVLTELTLTVCGAFDLVTEERSASLAQVLVNLPARLRADHYRFWYLPHADRAWEWTAVRTNPRPVEPVGRLARGRAWARDCLFGYHAWELALYAGTLVEGLVPPLNRAYAAALFSQPRAGRGPSRAMFTFDCLFKQHVDEWAIPVERTAEAMTRLRDLIHARGFRVHLPIEVRFVKGEDVWLSPTHGRDSCYIGVISYMPYGRSARYEEYFAAFEGIMQSLGGRPHWAKRFGLEAGELAGLYPRWSEFAALRAQLDPAGVFANAYTERVLGPVG